MYVPMSRFVHHERMTRRLGPLPVWAWVALVMFVVLVAADAYGITGSGSIDPTDPLDRSS